jgi:ATP-dependent Clp protease adapter protein ClpS
MLLNDDYTPAEYVVRVLQEEFGLGGLKATWVRHRDRRVTAAVGTRATFAVGCRP